MGAPGYQMPGPLKWEVAVAEAPAVAEDTTTGQAVSWAGLRWSWDPRKTVTRW